MVPSIKNLKYFSSNQSGVTKWIVKYRRCPRGKRSHDAIGVGCVKMQFEGAEVPPFILLYPIPFFSSHLEEPVGTTWCMDPHKFVPAQLHCPILIGVFSVLLLLIDYNIITWYDF